MSFLNNVTKFLVCTHKYIKTEQIGQKRFVKRWVGPTLRELKRRKEKFVTETRTARNTYSEWNQTAEMFAFGNRLNEHFNMEILHSAFVDRSFINQEELRQQNIGLENPTLTILDNRKLVEIGEPIIYDYVQEFLTQSLPNCPESGKMCILNWLTSEKQLAQISKNIGTKDLILCADNAMNNKILRDTFVAVVGALYKSSGEQKAYELVRDFVCTHLNQKDLSEIWHIEQPFNELLALFRQKNYDIPEPRMIGHVGINSVLAVYHIGIYSNKKMIGKGFGESIKIAIKTSALDALRKLYGIQENMKPFNFFLQLQNHNIKNFTKNKIIVNK